MPNLNLAKFSLFPLVILYGVLVGAIVYSHVAFIPVFLSDLPNSSVVVNGRYAINEAPFWMTIHPFLILSMGFALITNWKIKTQRNLIAVSFGIYIGVLIVTAAYFVPELLAFAESLNSDLPAAQWLERGHRWQYLSTIRGAVCFIGYLPIIISLSRSNDLR